MLVPVSAKNFIFVASDRAVISSCGEFCRTVLVFQITCDKGWWSGTMLYCDRENSPPPPDWLIN